MIIKLPNKRQIQAAKQKQVWDFGNAILYKMCKDNFTHKDVNRVLTKVLFIGRIYAAAVERRRNKVDDINDEFYIDVVAPTFIKSKLDIKLLALKKVSDVQVDNIGDVLQTHYYLTNMLQKITALKKRSFSSKYLHFHLPSLFYIYDSRALSALRHFSVPIPKDLERVLQLSKIDHEYANFYCKCFELQRQIRTKYKIDLTKRQLDNILIKVANQQNILKQKF